MWWPPFEEGCRALRISALRGLWAIRGEPALYTAFSLGKPTPESRKPIYTLVDTFISRLAMAIETIFRALADSTRLRILRLVGSMELAVGEIAQVLGQSQPRVSRHIGILTSAGLAERRREGSWVFLRAAPAGDHATPLHQAIAVMLEYAEQQDPDFARACAQDRQRLAAIRATREEEAAA